MEQNKKISPKNSFSVLADSLKYIKKFKDELNKIFSGKCTVENTQRDIQNSRKFILNLINADIAPFAQKSVIKKWAEKSFEYFHDFDDELYPIYFFISLFASDELIGYKSNIMCEYIRYIAEYVYTHKKNIRKNCFEEKNLPASKVYDKFRFELGCIKNKKRKNFFIILICVESPIITMIIGIQAEKSLDMKYAEPSQQSSFFDISQNSLPTDNQKNNNSSVSEVSESKAEPSSSSLSEKSNAPSNATKESNPIVESSVEASDISQNISEEESSSVIENSVEIDNSQYESTSSNYDDS